MSVRVTDKSKTVQKTAAQSQSVYLQREKLVKTDRLPKGKTRKTWRRKVMGLKS